MFKRTGSVEWSLCDTAREMHSVQAASNRLQWQAAGELSRRQSIDILSQVHRSVQFSRTNSHMSASINEHHMPCNGADSVPHDAARWLVVLQHTAVAATVSSR
jgi:hypothetical protein